MTDFILIWVYTFSVTVISLTITYCITDSEIVEKHLTDNAKLILKLILVPIIMFIGYVIAIRLWGV